MKTRYILNLDEENTNIAVAGGKGASLTRMVAAGLPVPAGYVVSTEAYRSFVNANNLQEHILSALNIVDIAQPKTLDEASQIIAEKFLQAAIPDEVADAVVQAYEALPGDLPAVAVRSSATAEDLPEASFAGQQETFLNVSGAADVLESTRKCWASLWTGRAIGYRARQGIAPESVALAVVVQLLVSADAAGILFTANPVTGSRDQIVINASWGLGEAVVGGLVTPDTLIVDKVSGKVVSRETANKLVQTVRVNGGTEETPVPANIRKTPVLSDSQAAELVSLGRQIEDLYEIAMDIEWVLANGKFAIVQARPITALPEFDPVMGARFSLPDGAYAAMRNNIVELMADPLTPLFSTMGLKAVNTSMDRMLTGFLGDTGVLPTDPIIVVNEYAYYNGSVKFGPMLKIILDTRGIMRRMFTGAVERWTEDGRPLYFAKVDKWREQDWRRLSSTEILAAVQQLSEAAIDAYGALVSGVIPAAWMSEGLFTLVYRLVKRRDDPSAPTYLMGFESLPIQAETSLYDLAQWTRVHPKLMGYLNDTPTQKLIHQLAEAQSPEGIDEPEWHAWQKRFRTYLDDYGHMIYNLDFGSPVPADDPAPVIDTFKLFLSGQGVNPHDRLRESASRREAATDSMLKRLKGRRLKIFQKNLERAQRYAPLREDGLADVGYSYPLLRQMLLEVGRRLVDAQAIQQPNEIFWLQASELESAAAKLDSGRSLDDLSARIPERKATWRAARRVEPPMMLPQIKIFGFDLMKLKSGRNKGAKSDRLKGVAASPGCVTAPACVVHGPEDFGHMKSGDVLVAPLTTPAWTPLFARAAAVVTDVGGPLSHGSIVAREYGIPAVLGTGAATKTIQSGQMITVDGAEGVVILQTNLKSELS